MRATPRPSARERRAAAAGGGERGGGARASGRPRCDALRPQRRRRRRRRRRWRRRRRRDARPARPPTHPPAAAPARPPTPGRAAPQLTTLLRLWSLDEVQLRPQLRLRHWLDAAAEASEGKAQLVALLQKELLYLGRWRRSGARR